jgi:tRNA A-37 threonylcarbamoyl transferase component Bud32
MTSPPEINGYRGLELISNSGQARIYRAHKTTFDNSAVAIKVYKRELDDADRRRFRREVEALLALRGRPHVVRLLEADFLPDGSGYVAMELYHRSVADRLAAEGVLSPLDAARIGVKVAEALGDAHEAPMRILHRDIKPSNVLLTEDGVPVLADFGISAIFRPDGQHTATAKIGTQGYMAPEVLAGAPDSVASDIYSLGATLHKLLLDEAPAVDAPTRLLPKLPEPVAEVLGRSLSPDPAKRQTSARQLAAELRRAEQQLSEVTAEFATPPPAATRAMTTEQQDGAEPVARPRLVDVPAFDPDLQSRIVIGAATLVGSLALLGLLDWAWWQSLLIAPLAVGAAVVIKVMVGTERVFGPAVGTAALIYGVPALVYLTRGDVLMAILVLAALGGHLLTVNRAERLIALDTARSKAEQTNVALRKAFERFRDDYWLESELRPPTWLDDVVELPGARAMPWRSGSFQFVVVCDRVVVLVAILAEVRRGAYRFKPTSVPGCRVYADGRPNTDLDSRLRDLLRKLREHSWGDVGPVETRCVVALTTDGRRSDGIQVTPAMVDTVCSIVLAHDIGRAVVAQLSDADPTAVDPPLVRAVLERARGVSN